MIAIGNDGRQRTLTDVVAQVSLAREVATVVVDWLWEQEAAVPVACPIGRSDPGSLGH